MKISNRIALAAAFAVASFGFAAPASAQATRTWVSGVGDDVNPCSRTAPCKTFAGAISKTAAGGEINCLDPGGYGTITITKSIIIDCTGTFGSILNSGGINGVNINDSATATPNTIDVVLRGIVINGAGTTPGLNGVRFLSGRSVTLENVYIENQKSGSGIAMNPAAAGRLFATNVTIVNGNNGVLVQPGAAGNARVLLNDVRILNNSGTGFHINMTGSTGGGVLASIEGSAISHNATGVQGTHVVGASGMTLIVNDSVVNNNTSFGIRGDGASATIRVGNTTVTGNATGISAANASSLRSFGDNRVTGNTSADGTFVAPVLPKI